METFNCNRCYLKHEDNGNCTAVGGFCTAVPAAHCPLLREYLSTGLMPEKVIVLQEKTRWIPVEERLPEISHSWGVSDIVLCIISDPSGYQPPNPGLCIYLEDGRWTCRGMFVRVTHWMPLPAGPEVE